MRCKKTPSLVSVFLLIFMMCLGFSACSKQSQEESLAPSGQEKKKRSETGKAPKAQVPQERAGKVPEPTLQASCTILNEEEPWCFEFTGSSWNMKLAVANCDNANEWGVPSEFKQAPCSKENVIARCVFSPGKNPKREMVYVYYQPMTLKMAEVMCPGEFIPES